jgi:hypothetical protein
VRPSIATVVGGVWEPRLIEMARGGSGARLVGRCSDLASLAGVAPHVDAIFIGSDAPWIHEADLRSLHLVTRLIGVASDAPGRRLLVAAGVEEIIESTTSPAGMLALATATMASDRGAVVEVTGPRGAPGRSEVALAMAFAGAAREPIAMLELDFDAPSLGLRLAVSPTPTLEIHRVSPLLSILPAPCRPSGLDVTPELVRTAAGLHTFTILDTGPDSRWHRRIDVDHVVFVGEATGIGVIRLARMCATWTGPTPQLVVNRHRPDQDLASVVRATGLEPHAVIPMLEPPPPGRPPHPAMRSVVGALLGQRAAV